MRIGFDAHALGRHQTGNETYVLGILHGLERINFPVSAYGYTAPPTTTHVWRRLRRKSRWLRLGLEIPLSAAHERIDLYHGVWALPPFLPCRTVVTVHDLTFLVHPDWLPRGQAEILRRSVGRAMRQAARVVAISERTKCDIVERYGIPEEKIAVTYLAPRPRPAAPAHSKPDGAQEYFLYVGNIVPRKNVAVLIRALGLLRDRGSAIPLVLAGQPGPGYRELLALVHQLNLDHLVGCTGYISDERLATLYAGCTAVVHPSLYEGFGLTPVEAMALGRPVLAAAAGALPEVVGEGGLLLPPNDAEAWAYAMEWVQQPTLNRDLSVRGLRRAKQFSWERCAKETVEVYRQVLQ